MTVHDTAAYILEQGGEMTAMKLQKLVNYAPDRAVEFDLDGNPVKSLDRAVRIGRLVGPRLPSLR